MRQNGDEKSRGVSFSTRAGMKPLTPTSVRAQAGINPKGALIFKPTKDTHATEGREPRGRQLEYFYTLFYC